MSKTVLLIVFWLLLSGVGAFADESADSPETVAKPAQGESAMKVEGPSTPVPQPKAKRKTRREKEAEGTQARRRFDRESIIFKSKYELDGEPLEVDTE